MQERFQDFDLKLKEVLITLIIIGVVFGSGYYFFTDKKGIESKPVVEKKIEIPRNDDKEAGK